MAYDRIYGGMINIRFLFLVVLAFVILKGDDVWAQAGETLADNPTCDSDFWDVMKARSTAEGQREIEMAERIILKLDSVLEYSCFDQDLERLQGLAASTLFSANVRRFYNNPAIKFDPEDEYQPTIDSPNGPQPNSNDNEGIIQESDGAGGQGNDNKYPGPEHFERNVTRFTGNSRQDGNAVMAGFRAYMIGDPANGNVEGNFNGGTMSGIPGAPSRGLCENMYDIWNFARCNGGNFDKDWFPTFSEIARDDPRDFPKSCNASEPNNSAQRRNQLWPAMIQASKPSAGQRGGVDKKLAYTKQLFEGNCRDSAVVLTGLQVRMPGGQPPELEGVCAMAGCTFRPGAGAQCQ